jgi:cytochrome c556
MKHMGRPFYLGIGSVVKGTAAYGPDTVTAAETVASLAATLDRSLFTPGSNVAESKMKPEIFAVSDHVDQLIAAVQKATTQLVPAVKTDDKAVITAAYKDLSVDHRWICQLPPPLPVAARSFASLPTVIKANAARCFRSEKEK